MKKTSRRLLFALCLGLLSATTVHGQPHADPLARWAAYVDQNANGFVEDAEILLAVAMWASGQNVPGEAEVVSDAMVQTLLTLWVTGRPHYGTLTAESSAELAASWFDLAGRLVRELRLSPPVASRVYGYLGVTLYEAVFNGMPGFGTLAGQVGGLPHPPGFQVGAVYPWPVVANAALGEVARALFDGSTAEFEIATLHARWAAQHEAQYAAAAVARAQARGRALGATLAAWSRTDGYGALDGCAYTPPQGRGLWAPTLPHHAPALQPCWGQLRPFALTAHDACQPAPPPAYAEARGTAFYEEAYEVYETVEKVTPAQRSIAQFWADNPGETSTPPGHWVALAGQLLREQGRSLAEAAEAYARLGIALADAFISCWKTKYDVNLVRPISYIRALIDPDWETIVPTPPFPEFTSGHSVASGAAAQVLTDLWGAFPFSDHTHDALGFAPRRFGSFMEAAQEAAISRLYGGIHFRAAIELGVEQGVCIGKRVSALQFKTARAGAP